MSQLINRLLAIACFLLAFTVALGVAADAQAGLAIRISSSGGAAPVTVHDNAAGDGVPIVGIVNYSGAFDNYIVSLTTGIGQPILGTTVDPVLHLDSVNVSGGGGGALTIELTQTGFTGSPMGLNPISFLTSIGGLTDGTVTIETFAGLGEFDDTVLLSSMTFVNGVINGTSTSGGLNLFDNPGVDPNDPAYSLTIRVTVDHAGGRGSKVTSFNAELEALPEPTAFMVWAGIASCFMGAGALRRRRPIAVATN